MEKSLLLTREAGFIIGAEGSSPEVVKRVVNLLRFFLPNLAYQGWPSLVSGCHCHLLRLLSQFVNVSNAGAPFISAFQRIHKLELFLLRWSVCLPSIVNYLLVKPLFVLL